MFFLLTNTVSIVIMIVTNTNGICEAPMEEISFGLYLSSLRLRRRLTLRDTAARIGISAAYLNDIEKGRRYPFSADRIEKFALLTECSEEERRRLYDLAGHDRGTVSEDVGEYLRDNSYLVAALRTAKKLNADESDWAHMLNELKKRKGV